MSTFSSQFNSNETNKTKQLRKMASRLGPSRSSALLWLQKSRQSRGVGKQILIRSKETQAVRDVPELNPYAKIPGPRGLPVIGTLLEYARDGGYKRWHEIQQERCREFGSIYREDIMSFKTVTISDPDDIENLFRHEGKYPTREPQLPIWMQYKKERKQAHGVSSL